MREDELIATENHARFKGIGGNLGRFIPIICTCFTLFMYVALGNELDNKR